MMEFPLYSESDKGYGAIGMIRGSRINEAWHKKNRMPKNPSLQERIKWHLEHSKNFACRPIPPKIREEIPPQVPSGKNTSIRFHLKLLRFSSLKVAGFFERPVFF